MDLELKGKAAIVTGGSQGKSKASTVLYPAYLSVHRKKE